VLAILFVIYNLFEAYKVKKDASVNVSLVTPFLSPGDRQKQKGTRIRLPKFSLKIPLFWDSWVL